MKKNSLLALIGGICLILVLASLPFMAACAKPAREEVKLTSISFVNTTSPYYFFYASFLDKVNERLKGELSIQSIGSSEAIPMQEMAAAAQKGVVDICFITSSYYRTLVPSAGINGLSQITAKEERQVGAYDYWLEAHKKAGLYYLGRGTCSEPTFYIWTNKKVAKPQDLAGQKILTSAKALAWVKALGCSGIIMPFTDFYEAIDKGVADGFAVTLVAATNYGWQEVTKYIIDHPVGANTVTITMNLDKWNSLSKHQQDILIKATKELEAESPAKYEEFRGVDRKNCEEAGVEFIKFSPDDAKWYTDLYYEVMWQDEMKLDAEAVAILKPMLTK